MTDAEERIKEAGARTDDAARTKELDWYIPRFKWLITICTDEETRNAVHKELVDLEAEHDMLINHAVAAELEAWKATK